MCARPASRLQQRGSGYPRRVRVARPKFGALASWRLVQPRTPGSGPAMATEDRATQTPMKPPKSSRNLLNVVEHPRNSKDCESCSSARLVAWQPTGNPDRLMELARLSRCTPLRSGTVACPRGPSTGSSRDDSDPPRWGHLTHCLAPTGCAGMGRILQIAGDEAAIGEAGGGETVHHHDADLPIPIVLPHTGPIR